MPFAAGREKAPAQPPSPPWPPLPAPPPPPPPYRRCGCQAAGRSSARRRAARPRARPPGQQRSIRRLAADLWIGSPRHRRRCHRTAATTVCLAGRRTATVPVGGGRCSLVAAAVGASVDCARGVARRQRRRRRRRRCPPPRAPAPPPAVAEPSRCRPRGRPPCTGGGAAVSGPLAAAGVTDPRAAGG